MHKILAQNFSKALGRFSLVDPENISRDLEKFAKVFCLSLRQAHGDESKQQAFR